MTNIFRSLGIFLVSLLVIIPASFFEVYVPSTACKPLEGILLFFKVYLPADRAADHLQQRMHAYSSKRISK